jgi:colanic acid biosynthesis glycosyl transferase WcaI
MAGLRFLVLSINYSPEPSGFAPHVAAMCEHLVARGHTVTVLTGFPFAPAWARWPGYRRGFIRTEQMRGVRVVRHTHFIPRSPRRLWQRIAMEGSFCLSCALSLLRSSGKSRPDLVVYVGAQPSLAMTARWYASLIQRPYAVIINDLASGAAGDVGIVKHRWLGRLLETFEFAAYRRAAGAVVLCQAFRDALSTHGFAADRVKIVRSPVDLERIRPVPAHPEFRTRWGVPRNAFVVLFAGSMGLKQGMTNIVEAAAILRATSPNIRWVLVGDGETKSGVLQLIERLNLQHNVRMLPFESEAKMSEMFASADVLLLNQLASVKDTVIPSKLLTYMAAGRPVIAAVSQSSQGAEILRDAGGGLIVQPEQPQALADGVSELEADSMRLEAWGKLNRHYAEANFDQTRILASLEASLLGAASAAAS